MYEYFEHTADVGWRVEASSLDALFEESARALFAIIVPDLETVRDVEERRIELQARAPADLLVDWLSELLFLFETEHLLLSRFAVHVAAGRLEARAWGEGLDPGRHRLGAEVKAVTYHDLVLEPCEQGYRASVIVDI